MAFVLLEFLEGVPMGAAKTALVAHAEELAGVADLHGAYWGFI